VVLERLTLGMGQHPKVNRIWAMVETATRMGTGAVRPPPPPISPAPNHPPGRASSGELADLVHGKEAALVSPRVYFRTRTSNLDDGQADAELASHPLGCLNHNSMIEGVRQSAAEKTIFPPQTTPTTSKKASQATEIRRVPKLKNAWF